MAEVTSLSLTVVGRCAPCLTPLRNGLQAQNTLRSIQIIVDSITTLFPPKRKVIVQGPLLYKRWDKLLLYILHRR